MERLRIKRTSNRIIWSTGLRSFDMSAKTDLTSVTFMIPYLSGEYDGNGKEIVKYYFWTHSFIPTREKLHEHIVKDKVPYDAWERQAFWK